MMGSAPQSPKQTRSKRDQLVEAALALFEREGYHATGIDRILEDAGVAKMTLYNHFTSKDELILAALRLRDERFRDWLARRVRDLGTTPRERLLAIFDAAGELFATDSFNGCLFARACGEFSDPDHPVWSAAKEHRRLFRRYVLELANDAGAPNPERLADSLLILFAGATAAAQMSHSTAPAAHARAVAKTILDAELGA